MKLYHYALKKLPQISAVPIDLNHGRLIAQTVMGDSRRPPLNENGHWGGSAVFFPDPMPMPMLDSVFCDSNPFWPKGVSIYEHIVEVNLLEDLFYYVLDPTELVEFQPGPPGSGQSYPEKWLSVMTRNNYIGNTVPELNIAIQRLVSESTMEDRLRGLLGRKDYEELSNRYTLGLPVICLRTRPGPVVPHSIYPVSH